MSTATLTTEQTAQRQRVCAHIWTVDLEIPYRDSEWRCGLCGKTQPVRKVAEGAARGGRTYRTEETKCSGS